MLQVQDLHSITPNYFLEVSGAVIHPLSYQQVRNYFNGTRVTTPCYFQSTFNQVALVISMSKQFNVNEQSVDCLEAILDSTDNSS